MLAPQLRQLLSQVEAQDARVAAQRAMLDHKLDLFNEITDWLGNTEHAEAAAEVSQILDKFATGKTVSAA